MALSPWIVSLLPSATEVVCALGLQEQLVGVSHECNWPTSIESLPRVTRSQIDATATSAQIDAQVKSFLHSSQALYGIDVELLVALAPDLILTQAQCDVCAVSYQSVQAAVASKKDLAATEVVALNPTSLEEVVDDVVRIGTAASVGAVAEEYRCSLLRRIEKVRSEPIHPCPRTLVIEWTDPLMVAGNWTPQLVEWAGGLYGLATAGEPSRYVEWQEICDFAPEVLVIAPCGFNLERAEAELKLLQTLPGWDALPAVRSKRVHPVDGDAFFNRPGPRLVDSLEMLASWLRKS